MFENRRAWQLENEQLRVTVLEGGGHIAEIVLKGDGGESINPLWIPTWPSIEPWAFDSEKHAEVYGTDSEGQLLAGIMGHNLCFDFWGAPSETEFAAGLAYHGETNVLPARKISQDANSLVHRFDLTQSQTAITRTMKLVAGQAVLYVEETAENKLSLDRPFGWVQHVTFGPPFLDPEATFFDASATKGDLGADQPGSLADWPVGPADEPANDYRRFAPEPPSYKMAYFLMDPERELEYIAAVNTDHNLLIAYLFHRKDYPWMMVWEENRNLETPPWNGKSMTRGMEFGNTRIPGTAVEYFKHPEMYGTRTFGWFDGKEKKTARYVAFMANVPEGFSGVADITIDGTDIVVAGQGVEAPVRVAFTPDLF